MLFKSLAGAGAAAAALSVTFVSPALAQDQEGGGCQRNCTGRVFQNGRPVAAVDVRVFPHSVTGTLHALRSFSVRRGDNLPVLGHCRPVRERERHEFLEQRRFLRERFRREREFFAEREFFEREFPEREFTVTARAFRAGVRTGFGGARHSVNLPLVAAALTLLAGGVGLSGLALRRRR